MDYHLGFDDGYLIPMLGVNYKLDMSTKNSIHGNETLFSSHLGMKKSLDGNETLFNSIMGTTEH